MYLLCVLYSRLVFSGTKQGLTLDSVVASAGYFKTLDGAHVSFDKCFRPESCLGFACAPGYRGPLCASCADYLTLTDAFACDICVDSQIAVAGIFVFIIVGFLSLAYLVWDQLKLSKAGKLRAAFFKIVISTMQVNASALAFAFNWEAVMEDLFSVQQSVSSFGTTYLSWSCLTGNPNENTFVLQTLVYGLSPFVFFLFCCLIALSYAEFHHSKFNFEWVYSMTIIFMFMFQPTLAEQTFRFVAYSRLSQNSDRTYMTANLAIEIGSPEHNLLMLAIALPMALLYLLGTFTQLVRALRNLFVRSVLPVSCSPMACSCSMFHRQGHTHFIPRTHAGIPAITFYILHKKRDLLLDDKAHPMLAFRKAKEVSTRHFNAQGPDKVQRHVREQLEFFAVYSFIFQRYHFMSLSSVASSSFCHVMMMRMSKVRIRRFFVRFYHQHSKFP